MGGGEQYKDIHQSRAAYSALPRGDPGDPPRLQRERAGRAGLGKAAAPAATLSCRWAPDSDHHLGATIPGAGRKLFALSYRLQRKETTTQITCSPKIRLCGPQSTGPGQGQPGRKPAARAQDPSPSQATGSTPKDHSEALPQSPLRGFWRGALPPTPPICSTSLQDRGPQFTGKGLGGSRDREFHLRTHRP